MKRKVSFVLSSLLILSPFSISMTSCHNTQIPCKEMEIVSFQPYYTTHDPEIRVPGWELPEGFEHYADLVKGAGDYLANHIDSIEYETCSKEEYINADLLSKMGKNQIIMFEGHGSYMPIYELDPYCYSVIWTGRDYDEELIKPEDIQEKRIVNADYYHEAITLNFIDEYVGDLTGSIVYLGNCHSGHEVTLAQAFLNKGAEAVIGNSDTIQVAYNSLIEYTTIKKLGEINKDTNKLYTIYEALEYAKSIYGKNDAEKHSSALGAEPLLFGNPNFRISK